MKTNYCVASHLIDLMEKDGVISEANCLGAREVLKEQANETK